jgi:hypothetical protein
MRAWARPVHVSTSTVSRSMCTKNRADSMVFRDARFRPWWACTGMHGGWGCTAGGDAHGRGKCKGAKRGEGEVAVVVLVLVLAGDRGGGGT